MSDQAVIQVNWAGGMAFSADVPSGVRFVMDAHPESGGDNLGPTPVEALLSATAACSGMDVISILQKKKQSVDSYRMEVTWERGPEGVYPRPVTKVIVKHILTGENLDPAAVARSVELSDQKYCTVVSTLRINAEVESTWQIAE